MRARLYNELNNFYRNEMPAPIIVDNEGGHLTVGEIAEIKARVVKLVNKYYSSRDNTIIPKEIMNIPYTFMGTPNTPPFAATDPEKVVEQYNNYNKSVLEAEPDKHEAIYTPNNVCVLSRTSAIISGNNTHLRSWCRLYSVQVQRQRLANSSLRADNDGHGNPQDLGVKQGAHDRC